MAAARSVTLALLSLVCSGAMADEPRTWSGLEFVACDRSDSLQHFRLDVASGGGGGGQVVDRTTGRCLTVDSCDAAGMPGVRLDRCGGPAARECDGKNQKWQLLPVPVQGQSSIWYFTSALGGTDLTGGGSDPPACMNLPYTLQPGGPVNMWSPCDPSVVDAANNWFKRDSGMLKLEACSIVGWPTLHPCCSAEGGCCLRALPCVAPCVLPARWGWALIAVLMLGTALYIGGGMLYNHRQTVWRGPA